MKSTMKSAFAFIAVAMMIMVAVVPMVSVFTEDSSAATIVPATTKSITVSGTVADSDSQKIKDALIAVSYTDGTTYTEYGLTGADGKYTVAVNYSGASVDLKVAIVIDETYATMSGLKTANPAVGKFTASNNSQEVKGATGNVSGIDFMSGFVTISGKLTYKNTSEAYDKAVNVVVKTAPATGEGVRVNSVNSNADGTYSVLVPVNKGDVKVYCDGFATSSKLTVAKANLTVPNLANETTYKAYVSYANGSNTLSLSAGDGIEDLSELTAVTKGEVYDGKYSFTYKLKETGDKKVTISDAAGYGYPQEMSLSSPSTYAFKENACIVGTIYMGASSTSKLVLIADAIEGNITIDYYKGTEKQGTSLSDVTPSVLYGVYTIPFGKVTDFGEINKVVITYKIDENTKGSTSITAIPAKNGSTYSTANITIANTGYYYIGGTIAAGVGAEVTSSKGAVGLVDGKVTAGLDGKYGFYAKSGANVTIKPVVENEAVFTPSSQTLIANKDTTVNFELKTKELTSTAAVTDAAGNALSGITVNYVVGLDAVKTVTTGKDGKFKITVDSNVSADEVMVYFTDSAGKYTFAAKDLDSVVKMSESSFKANEQTLTFKVTDAAGNAIEDISDITFQVAKYKIHAAAKDVKAFDIIGTASDVAYDATTGTFSFVAEKLTATDDYRIQYGISVKSNTTDYTFAAITEFADNLVIKANEQTYKGKVTDATGDDANALKGMTVAVYDSSAATATKISSDVTTLNDGSFTVVSKAGYVKVVDPEGVYTFTGAETTALNDAIKANEQTYTGTVTDADGVAVKNANITVAVFDTDGEIVGSIATVAKDGSYEIVTKLVAGYEVVTVDINGVRTFKDVKITATDKMPDIKSGQCTISGKVILKTAATPLEGITVTLSIYSTTVDPVVVDTAVTDKDGKYSFFVDNVATGYGVVATNSGDYIFSATETEVSSYKADITTEYAMKELVVKDANRDALAGIKVKVTKDDVVVGDYVSDANGKFKHPDITDVKYEAVDPNGVYTFTAGAIIASEKTYSVTVTSVDGTSLEGITVSFLEGGAVVKTAVTDKDGKVSVAIKASNNYNIAATDGNTKYGAVTFGSAVAYSTTQVIKSKESIYSGYYANGDVVSGVTVTYQISTSAGAFVEKGKATVIDNKYYIVTAAETANSIKVDANAEGFYATAEFNSLSEIKTKDLKITEKDGVVTVDKERGLGKYYFVYNYENAQVGDKILLSAVNAAFLPLEDGNETTVLKYVFKGWYVNGEKISDDLEYTYTVTGECIVYADYEVSSYGATPSPSNGVDSTTLAIGIAAVIIALIAVVYAVIQKKKE